MKEICLFVFLFNCLFFNCMHATSFVNKTMKNDHPIALYQIILKLSNKIPSCALLIWMNTDYWVCNFVFEIIIGKQRKDSRQENQNVESWLVIFKLYSFFKRLEGYFVKVLLRRNFHFFFPTVFLKNVKYRSKLREITMNRVRLNIFCLDITLQKSQKLVRHCFVR